MVVKFLVFLFFIYSVSSRNIQWNFNANKATQPTATLTPEKIHLNIHENSYSAEDIYKSINECVEKCMLNLQQHSKKNTFDDGRDNCIQTQCRFYQ